MSYQVNEIEFKSVLSLDAPKRYEYFIKKICDWEEIWSIKDTEGWRLLGDPSECECIPVWPAKRYAEAFCIDDWSECYAESISLDSWKNAWLPGIKKDRRIIAVFPNLSLEAVDVESDRLREDIEEELSSYE